jgi:predicted HD superfamily hydrolase involved in NAD metabolism
MSRKIIRAIKKDLKSRYSNNSRLSHIFMVMKLSVKLAKIHNVDIDRMKICALCHDICKQGEYQLLTEEDKKEMLYVEKAYHGPISAKYSQIHYQIDDEIYNAIYYHTGGKPSMTKLQEILVIADFAEVSRRYQDEAKVARDIAYKDLDKAVLYVLESKKNHVGTNSSFENRQALQDKALEYYSKLINNQIN